MVFKTQLLDCDAKRVHLFHEMYHAEQDYLAATNETIVMNIDYATPQVRPLPGPGRRATGESVGRAQVSSETPPSRAG